MISIKKNTTAKAAGADSHAEDTITTLKSIDVRHKWIIKIPYDSGYKHPTEMFTSSFATPLYESMVWKLQLFIETKYEVGKIYKDYFSLSVSLKSDCYPVNAGLNLYAIDSNNMMHKIHSSSHAFDDQAINISPLISKENLKKFLVGNTLTIVCDINVVPPGARVSLEKLSFVNLQRDFLLAMLKPDDYKDVVFVTKSEEFHAHKCILSARSVVFDALFKNCKDESVLINVDCDWKVMLEMLRFVYTGRVKKLDEVADELLALAHHYELMDLVRMCEASLYEGITRDNAIDRLKLSDKLGAKDLKRIVLQYIARNLKHVIKTDGYRNLEKANSPLIAEILRSTI